MSRILVIEDDAATSAALGRSLRRLGHEVLSCPSAELGLRSASEEPPELVLLDVHLPGRTGLDALPELLALEPPPAVVVITAHPTAETAMDALALGAAAHLEKPIDPLQLAATVRRVLPEPGSPEPDAEAERPRLVGASPAMVALGGRVGALARSEVAILIRGESGTGKEVVARAIHARSRRADKPLVALNCAALPENLVEAELFGHERGAFTGADRSRGGRVEEAEGGTLFLDEVGELAPRAQAKLLRFLEERTYERVGGGGSRQADVRLIAATNAPLEDRLEAGSFREDLYYRLNVATLEIPPLRQRPEDVPLLVAHFLAREGRPEVRLEEGLAARLSTRSWPGNVRELRNAVLAALAALGPGRELRREHFAALSRAVGQAPSPQPAPADDPLSAAVIARVQAAAALDEPPPGLFHGVKDEVERALIGAALTATEGNQVAAARLLELNRATLRRKMAQWGLLGD